MSSQQTPKKVQDVQPAPIVGPDPTSPEAILARNAKTVQLQADSDSKFDTVLERFSDSRSRDGMPLVAVGLGLLGIGALVLFSNRRRK